MKWTKGMRDFQRRGLGDEREVVRLLDGSSRASMAKPARAHGHHVLVVAEDRQRLGGDGAGRDMEHRRGQLAGDLEHVGQHEEQPLRRGERRRQRAGLERAVEGAGRTGLRLHLLDHRHVAPDVGLARRPPTASASSAIGEDGVIG